MIDQANCVVEKNLLLKKTTPDNRLWDETAGKGNLLYLSAQKVTKVHCVLAHRISQMRDGGFMVIKGGVVTRNRWSINQFRPLLGAWLFFMCSTPDCFLFSTSCRPEAPFANGIGYSYVMKPGCFLLSTSCRREHLLTLPVQLYKWIAVLRIRTGFNADPDSAF